MKIHGLLTLMLLLPGTLFAEAVGDKDGLLKQFSHQQIDQRIHEHLIGQIKIDNPQPPKPPPVVDVMHSHPAIPGCTKATQHKHSGPLGHQHRYGCRRAAPRPAPKAAVYSTAAAPQASATNVQEQGVDEADFVKTDGRYLYGIENANNSAAIRIYDTQHTGGKLQQISAIGFGQDMQLTGLYLLAKQQKLIAIGNSYRNKVRDDNRKRRSPVRRRGSGNTSIIVVDISNKTHPRTLRHTRIEGSAKTTRRIKDKLYIVLNSYSFSFPSTYKYLETTRPLNEQQQSAIRAEITADIKKWTIADKIPHYRTPGKPGAHPLIQSGNFFLNPHDMNSWGLTTILAIDLKATDFRYESMGWFGGGWGTTVYASQKTLYVTSGYYAAEQTPLNKHRFPADQGSRLIHKFAFTDKGFDYRGSGAVLGNFKWTKLSSFQLDEDQHGNLRVVTYTWGKSKKSKDPATQSPVILTALAEHPRNKQLITLDRLPNKTSPKALGKPGEQLYGARLFDDYAYFVTFKRTDPLYVVDMRNPRQLKVTGELIIPGFSDYLHPLGDGLLLGVGKEAEDDGGAWAQLQGLKLSLYDVGNPHKPAEIHKIVVGKRGTDSPANRDHHAFTSLAIRGTNTTRVALPVSLVEDEDNYRGKDGLHRFEVDRKQRRIKHLGAMKPLNGDKQWRWYGNDRSIIIGDKLYYYHDGHFWQGDW